MVRRILNRPNTYRTLGTLFLSGGIALTCFLGSRFVREEIDAQISHRAKYLLLTGTPAFMLPPATPLPTLTPTPLPTATPAPLPATRLSIPAIGLNTTIEETFPTRKTTSAGGKQRFVWEPVAFAVGHHNTSGSPGGGGNIVLDGHNNTQGEVFRRLPELQIGDEVILFTADDEFYYRVTENVVVPYLGAEAEGDAKLQSYAAPTTTERVTLISCWPYVTNAHRIVVIAEPASGEDKHGR